MSCASWLVVAVGNPSRGDDALGPALLDLLRAEGVCERGDVELLTDFQLQVEHALDVQGRTGVLFVDAARAGFVESASLTEITADERLPPASHALRPQAVLHVAEQMNGRSPPAWLLAIEGRSFELGEGLSPDAVQHLARAAVLAREWLRARRTGESVGSRTVEVRAC